MTVRVNIKRLSLGARMPVKAHSDDTGWDLRALDAKRIEQGETVRIRTGIAVEVVTPGYAAAVRPRSGMSTQGLIVPIGTIDRGYRGDVGVIITNTTLSDMWVQAGDRIAQLVIECVPTDVDMAEVVDLSDSERGAAGFGSTGVR